jgi:hypothetical protein
MFGRFDSSARDKGTGAATHNNNQIVINSRVSGIFSTPIGKRKHFA